MEAASVRQRRRARRSRPPPLLWGQWIRCEGPHRVWGPESLPEECISRILTFTSPRDVCQASVVSSAFRSAASVNVHWHRFLPPDWEGILGRCSSDPMPFSSRKELYFRLCDSILVDGGTKVPGGVGAAGCVLVSY